MLGHGLRIGELLSLRVEDVDLGRDEFRIIRRPDAPDDPRRRQPLVKTNGRLEPLLEVSELTEDYMFRLRARIPGARAHPFLFVDVRNGRPLSTSAASKVFRQLGRAIGLQKGFSPHVLRHTWNDLFSEHMDREHVPEELEKRMRNHLQGWSDDSAAAATYTRRHVREAAAKALASMHARLFPAAGRPDRER
jgi:integrase